MKNNQKKKITKIVFAAMFLALAYVLPFINLWNPEIGNVLLPMHLPVMLCGYVCGGPWGMVVGIVAPLLRSLTLGMPAPFYPRAIAMAIELGAYGFLSGMTYKLLPKKKVSIYISLLISMIGGRIIRALVQMLLIGFTAEKTIFVYFFSELIVKAIPGIILQILFIPVIVTLIDYKKKKENRNEKP
jgi:LytS/YehU family sensor histidine kinase